MSRENIADPMIGVRLDDGTEEEFWCEELAGVTAGESEPAQAT